MERKGRKGDKSRGKERILDDRKGKKRIGRKGKEREGKKEIRGE